jgi:hypothetical protein
MLMVRRQIHSKEMGGRSLASDDEGGGCEVVVEIPLSLIASQTMLG